MCLACMEYLKGNLTDSEFKHNMREFVNAEHDPLALAKAEIKPEAKDKKEKKQEAAKARRNRR